LQNLPKPHIKVEAFKQDLRRDLNRAMSQSPQTGYRLAPGFAGGLAGALAIVLVLFIARPEMPARLNAWISNTQATQTQVAETVGESVPMNALNSPNLHQLLVGGQATPARDEAFIEDWYAKQEQPARVKKIEDEKIYAIRKYQLTSGQRVVVFTELGDDGNNYKHVSKSEHVRAF